MSPGTETRQRTENVRVRLDGDELAAIRGKAQAAGLSLSAFMRAAALERKIAIRPTELLSGLTNLGKLGGLLKLALAQIDQGKAPGDLRGKLDQTLDDIRDLAAAIRSEVG
ncbi:MAG: ribbon-helix-helix protein, CopG family [Candidatus Eremiobacteraeota bacterium]|nr:ribbon-helix-helix protein, CopG family [Candidatus Eremiobacteraeota bacterium]